MVRPHGKNREEVEPEGYGDGNTGGFHILQPNRDPESNFEVDLATNLEEYLLKICSGEITAADDHGHHSVNFAEAALLLQGSVQVYSRKVEYLYTLVLHALEFVSQKRQDYQENSSVTPDKDELCEAVIKEEENFLSLDDIAEEPKNCLSDGSNSDDILDNFAKPPANLLALEGECLCMCGDVGELESYLLSTCNFYGDFLLLDPCDAVAVNDFFKAKNGGIGPNVPHKLSSMKFKGHSCFSSSPANGSRGSRQKSSARKKHDAHLNNFSAVNLDFDVDCHDKRSESHNECNPPDYDMCHGGDLDNGYSDAEGTSDSDDNDDPWRPLNPHKIGNLKVKPFQGKTFVKKLIYSTKRPTIACEFPLAKLDQIASPTLAGVSKQCFNAHANLKAPHELPLFEKLRQSLVYEEPKTTDNISDIDDNDEYGFENASPDIDQDDFNMPQSIDDNDTYLNHEKCHDETSKYDDYELPDHDDFDPDASLEDLCRSHLDTLLASIAETQKQTELATRVSTWKQRIEHTLNEQDSHPPFDIHLYGERVLGKLSTSGDSGGSMRFTDVVVGQEKHEIARTFSALLQLVNNRNVDLDQTQGERDSFCYTAENPFYVRLVDLDRGIKEIVAHLSKKRTKSPLRKGPSTIKSPNKNSKLSLKLEKDIAVRFSPHKKGRQRL